MTRHRSTHLARVASALVLAASLFGCTTARTEILVVTDTDLAVPSELDAFRVEVTGPGGAMQASTARFGPGDPLPPRTLGLVYDQGRLGPYRVRVQGAHHGGVILERVAKVAFQRGTTLVLRVDLTRDCVGVSCNAEETCAAGVCRPVLVGPDELTPFEGQLPGSDAAVPIADGGSRFDAGSIDGGEIDGGCGMSESCNGADDDCDGTIDEGFDLTSNPSHCGSCGNACRFPHATASCEASACVLTGCMAGFDDCDGDPSNGCEADLTQPATCGGCGNACRPPTRACCAGTCQSGC